MNCWKVPFLTTARMPLTFHEYNFMAASIGKKGLPAAFPDAGWTSPVT
jgi:hypothetical protein